MQAIELISTEGMSHEEWLSWRDKGLGGSDAAVLCGLNRYKSPMELWLEKTGQQEPKEAGEAAYWGTIMETIIKAEFNRRTGLDVAPVQAILQHQQYAFMLANLDGLVVDPIHGKGIFEAKTANVFLAPQFEQDIPEMYQAQVHHYLALTGLSHAYVAVLIGGNAFKYFHIRRNDEVINLLIQLEKNFWENHVLANVPPELDGTKASSELLKQLYPEGRPNTHLELPEEAMSMIEEFEQAKDDEAEATERKEAMANKLKEMLGENEIGVVNGRSVAWKTVNSERFNSKSFKRDYPDLHEQYVSQSSYRRFTVK